MAIRAKWRKARANKNPDEMLAALDEAESRGSTVSGSVTQDEDQAMRGLAAQEARAAAAKLYMLRKASGNGPEDLKAAKNRLNAAGGESSLTVPQAPPTSAVAPGNGKGAAAGQQVQLEEMLDERMRKPSRFVGNNPYGSGTGTGDSGQAGASGAEGPAGGALTSSMSKMFGSDTSTVGPNDKVPFGYRETGVAKGGRKMISRVDEQGPEVPESIEQGKPKENMLATTVDAVGKVTTALSDYGREYLKRRYSKGVPTAVRDTMAADKKAAERNLEEQKTLRDAKYRADAATTERRNANAQAFRRRAMANFDRDTASTRARQMKTEAELDAGQMENIASMNALAAEEDASDARMRTKPYLLRKFMNETPAETRSNAGSLKQPGFRNVLRKKLTNKQRR